MSPFRKDLRPGSPLRRHTMIARILQIVLTAGLLAADSHAEPPPPVEDTLRTLEKNFAGITNVQTGFVQEKDLAVLSRKMVLKGTIALQNPGRFAWHVETPLKYGLVIADGNLKQWDEDSDRIQQMALSANPVFQVAVGQIQAWFAGRFVDLTKDFEVQPVAQTPLILEFAPRTNSLAHKAVKCVRLTFRDDRRYVTAMCIEEKSGDRTTMTFTNTVLNGPLDPAVWEVKPHGR
jgi:outer membrane lipoprotein-sorting protein